MLNLPDPQLKETLLDRIFTKIAELLEEPPPSQRSTRHADPGERSSGSTNSSHNRKPPRKAS